MSCNGTGCHLRQAPCRTKGGTPDLGQDGWRLYDLREKDNVCRLFHSIWRTESVADSAIMGYWGLTVVHIMLKSVSVWMPCARPDWYDFHRRKWSSRCFLSISLAETSCAALNPTNYSKFSHAMDLVFPSVLRSHCRVHHVFRTRLPIRKIPVVFEVAQVSKVSKVALSGKLDAITMIVRELLGLRFASHFSFLFLRSGIPTLCQSQNKITAKPMIW